MRHRPLPKFGCHNAERCLRCEQCRVRLDRFAECCECRGQFTALDGCRGEIAESRRQVMTVVRKRLVLIRLTPTSDRILELVSVVSDDGADVPPLRLLGDLPGMDRGLQPSGGLIYSAG